MCQTLKTVSVIIPTKNAEDRIGMCLESICNQSHKPFEVIVVDGHSTDRTLEQLQTFPVEVLSEDYGTVGGARQVGVEKATGEFVALTDDDTIPDKDWLKNLLEAFSDESILGVGGGVKYYGSELWTKPTALCLNSLLGSGNSVQGRLFKERRWVKSISGCNSMYRKEPLIKIGGFNVGLSINEETELNKRICKKGKLLYVPNAVVLHQQARGLKAFAKRMRQFGHGRGRLRLWSLQCAFPLVACALLFTLPFTIWPFLVGICAYLLAIGYMGLKFAFHERNAKYVATVPIVYMIEHFSYSIGFWQGLLK